MKILVIQGSPHKEGSSNILAEQFRAGAEKAGHEVSVFDAAHAKIAPCIACEYCHTRGGGVCCQQDDMETLKLDKLDSLTHCRYGAGTVLLFTYNTEEDWKNPLEEGVHSGVEDVSITAAYIMLRAIELGVYTTWCNYFANSKLEQAFDLPENEKAVLVMPIGYPAEGVVPAPAHMETKAFDSVIRYK